MAVDEEPHRMVIYPPTRFSPMARLSEEEKQRRLEERTNSFNQAIDEELNQLRDTGWDYKFLASLDCRTCEVCGRLDGRVFKVSEARRGVNLPCMHLGCRCTIVANLPDKYRSPSESRSARHPDGSTYSVPFDTTWEQWKKSL